MGLRTAPFDACYNAIAVHGVTELVRWDEEVAFEISARLFGNDEAIPVAVRYQLARQQIGILRGSWRGTRRRSRRALLGRFLLEGRTFAHLKTAFTLLPEEALALQTRQDFRQGTAARVPQRQAFSDFAGARWLSKVREKTQDLIVGGRGRRSHRAAL